MSINSTVLPSPLRNSPARASGRCAGCMTRESWMDFTQALLPSKKKRRNRGSHCRESPNVAGSRNGRRKEKFPSSMLGRGLSQESLGGRRGAAGWIRGICEKQVCCQFLCMCYMGGCMLWGNVYRLHCQENLRIAGKSVLFYHAITYHAVPYHTIPTYLPYLVNLVGCSFVFLFTGSTRDWTRE